MLEGISGDEGSMEGCCCCCCCCGWNGSDDDDDDDGTCSSCVDGGCCVVFVCDELVVCRAFCEIEHDPSRKGTDDSRTRGMRDVVVF